MNINNIIFEKYSLIMTIRIVNLYSHHFSGIIQCFDKTIEWWLNGQFHREDGPAVEYFNGDKFWCEDGCRHRLNGPAIELSGGYKAWYINGIQYSEKEYWKEINIRENIVKYMLNEH